MTPGGKPSVWCIIALTVSLVALGLHSAGYGTNYWMVRYGLRKFDHAIYGDFYAVKIEIFHRHF